MASHLEIAVKGAAPARYELGSGTAVIGRSEEADVHVAGDPHLSRRHAEVSLQGERLRVRRLSQSSNAIYHAGTPKDDFSLSPGDFFVIGGTRFTFIIEKAAVGPADKKVDPTPQMLMTMNRTDLYAMGGEASDRLKLLDLLELPEILRSRDRKDFYAHIAGLLRLSAGGTWACVVTEDGRILGEDAASDTAARYKPSRSLIKKALEDSPLPTVYSWNNPGALLATVQEGLDWAVCSAAKIPGEPAVIFYASGRDERGRAALRQEEARFVGLVADMVGRSLSMDRLLTMEGRLERFFAGPVVDKILKSPDMRELDPRVAQSTVLFFDIRGFSKRTEEKNEEILAYIGELRRAMTAMTGAILEERGVVLQYMGDGILACWNVPFGETGHVDRACRAALRMAGAIGHTTGGWSCGIGIHTGEVVAGAIGSEQVFAYGVMGKVVNQASRVEGITKILKTPILITGEAAAQLKPEAGAALRVGRFKPAGMNDALDLFELSAPPGDPARAQLFSTGLALLEKGDFAGASKVFSARPFSDGPASFLNVVCETLMARPPAKWDGVIELTQK
jgi:adenylate cyclase